MNIKKIIQTLKTDTTVNILIKIIATNNKIATNIDDLITVRVTLISGCTIEVIPIKYDQNFNLIFLNQKKNFIYLNANNVIAIEIINSKKTIDVLTDNKYVEINVKELPSKLELKRILKNSQLLFNDSFNIRLSTKLLDEESLTDETRNQFNLLLKILKKSLENIIKDPLGKQAIKKVKEIHIKSTNNDFFISQENSKFTLEINFNMKFDDNLETKITSLIEQNL